MQRRKRTKWLVAAGIALAILAGGGAWYGLHRPLGKQGSAARAMTDPSEVENALRAADSKEPAARRKALLTLALAKAPEGHEWLKRALNDGAVEVRRVGALGLALAARADSENALTAALLDPDLAVRVDAVWGLSRLPEGRGSTALNAYWSKAERIDARLGYLMIRSLAKVDGAKAAEAILDGGPMRLVEPGKSDDLWRQNPEYALRVGGILSEARSGRAKEVLSKVKEGEKLEFLALASRMSQCQGISFIVETVANSESEEALETARSAMKGTTASCAVDALLAFLPAKVDPKLRLAALALLPNFGGKQVVQRVGTLIDDQDARVAEAARLTHRSLNGTWVASEGRNLTPSRLHFLDPGDSRTGPYLMRVYAGDDPRAKMIALEALATTYAPEDSIWLDSYAQRRELLLGLRRAGLAELPQLLGWLTPERANMLVSGLASMRTDVRSYTGNLLRLFGHPNTMRPILALVPEDGGEPPWSDFSPFVDASSLLQFLEALDSHNPTVRGMALDALEGVLEPAASSRVLALLGDSEPWIRAKAAQWLGNARAPRFGKELLSKFEAALKPLAEAPAGIVQRSAIIARAKLAGDKGAPALESLLGRAELEQVPVLLGVLLLADPSRAKAALVSGLRSEDEAWFDIMVRGILPLCQGIDVILLEELASASSAVSRARVLRLLGRCAADDRDFIAGLVGDAEAKPPLQKVLARLDGEVADELCCTLSRDLYLGWAPHQQLLRGLDSSSVWRRLADTGSEKSQECASKVLAAVSDDAAFLPLVAKAHDQPNLQRELRGHVTAAVAKALIRRLAELPANKHDWIVSLLAEAPPAVVMDLWPRGVMNSEVHGHEAFLHATRRGPPEVLAQLPQREREPLMKWIRSSFASSREERSGAAHELARVLPEPSYVEPLVKLLEAATKNDERVRIIATLGRIRSKAAARVLAKQLGSPQGEQVARELLRQNATGERWPLLEATTRVETREEALKSLFDMVDDASLGELVQRELAFSGLGGGLESLAALADSPWVVPPELVAPFLARRGGAQDAVRVLGRLRAHRYAAAMLATDVPTKELCRAFATWSSGAAAEALVDSLTQVNARVRAHAAECLGIHRQRSAFDALVARLGDTNSEVRSAAALALGNLGDSRALKPLGEYLNTRLPGVEDFAPALAGWARLAGESAVAPLAEFAAKVPKSEQRSVYLAAVEALGHTGSPAAVAPLERVLSDATSHPVIQSAIRALGAVGDAGAVGALTPWLARKPYAPNAVQSLVALHQRAATPAILEFLRAAGAPWRNREMVGIIDALGELGDRRAVEALIGYLNEDSYEDAAARALGSIGGERALSALEAQQKRRPRRSQLQAVATLKANEGRE